MERSSSLRGDTSQCAELDATLQSPDSGRSCCLLMLLPHQDEHDLTIWSMCVYCTECAIWKLALDGTWHRAEKAALQAQRRAAGDRQSLLRALDLLQPPSWHACMPADGHHNCMHATQHARQLRWLHCRRRAGQQGNARACPGVYHSIRLSTARSKGCKSTLTKTAAGRRAFNGASIFDAAIRQLQQPRPWS